MKCFLWIQPAGLSKCTQQMEGEGSRSRFLMWQARNRAHEVLGCSLVQPSVPGNYIHPGNTWLEIQMELYLWLYQSIAMCLLESDYFYLCHVLSIYPEFLFFMQSCLEKGNTNVEWRKPLFSSFTSLSTTVCFCFSFFERV